MERRSTALGFASLASLSLANREAFFVLHSFQREVLASELADIVGPQHISSLDSDRLIYTGDWSWMSQMWLDRGEQPPLPDFIVHPGSAAEISRVLRVAASHGLPVVPWGGGSGTQGGAAPLYGGIVLDTKRLDRILEIDERSLTVRAQAGINGTTLEWALNERGLTLPHYPASANCATLGGYLAARGSGVISTKYGKAEDLALSIEVALPSGEIMRTLPTPNHASGPGLLQLFVGSEGTLGVITEATMRVEQLPEVRLLRGVLFDNLQAALEAGRRIMTDRLQPCVLRLYDQASTTTMLKRVLGLDAAGACFIIGFDGWSDIAEAQERRALAICDALGGQDLGREPGEHWWEHRYDFYYPPLALALPKLYGTTDTVCTYDKIERLYYAKKRAIEEDFAEWNARYIAHFSHWFPWGVMVYDRFVIDQPPQDPIAALQLHNQIWTSAARTSLACGAVLNEHHGIGWKLGRLMREQHDTAWPLLESLKALIDPHSIMNPGKLGFPARMTR
jgi:alkyldihydroxyacetonephosphate synthase